MQNHSTIADDNNHYIFIGKLQLTQSITAANIITSKKGTSKWCALKGLQSFLWNSMGHIVYDLQLGSTVS